MLGGVCVRCAWFILIKVVALGPAHKRATSPDTLPNRAKTTTTTTTTTIIQAWKCRKGNNNNTSSGSKDQGGGGGGG